jgi:hypothetical protein
LVTVGHEWAQNWENTLDWRSTTVATGKTSARLGEKVLISALASRRMQGNISP